MGYDFKFRFIKDDLIDPNMAFIQNVDNFLFCIYFNYLERYRSDIKEERNKLLADLFRAIKNSLMGGGMQLGTKKINLEERVKEILEEKDEGKRELALSKLDLDVNWSFHFPHVLDELVYLKFTNNSEIYAETQVSLILYCILVNGLGKTKGEKFDQIKKEMQPLIKILKRIFVNLIRMKYKKKEPLFLH